MQKFDEDHAAAATNLVTKIQERDSDDDEQDDALQLKWLHILVKYMNILLINISSTLPSTVSVLTRDLMV